MLPLSFKMILGFALICMIIISLMTVAAIINRPRQIQQLEAYEQKLTSISTHKVSEDHYATGRNSQVYNFKIIYEHIEFEKIKALLSNDRIKWREYKNRHIIGYDLNYDVTIKIEGYSSDNRVIVVLSTEK